MADGSRHFADLPQNCSFDSFREGAERLDGAVVTDYVTDRVAEMWLDFSIRGHEFTVNNQTGEYWFFVMDPTCPDEILTTVIDYFEPFLLDAAEA